MSKLSRAAESRVCNWMRNQGWHVLKQNHAGTGFELDFLAIKDDLLLVGEVKARPRLNHHEQIHIPSMISHKKLICMRKGTDHFIANHKLDYKWIRMDLFVVMGAGLNRLARYKDIGPKL